MLLSFFERTGTECAYFIDKEEKIMLLYSLYRNLSLLYPSECSCVLHQNHQRNLGGDFKKIYSSTFP
jgi:hypothetical protein